LTGIPQHPVPRPGRGDKHWATVIPAQAWADGIGAALLIGVLAGLLPAIRAARMSPTQALCTV
jgi:putative ABC transport system permease protein